MRDLPSKVELIEKLDDLCLESESRDQVARWAMSYLEDDNVRPTDKIVWRILEGLGAVDLPAPDRDYLYTSNDFKAWKAELLGD